MTTCDSSLIQAYEYDDSAWILTLVFKSNGDVRTYPDFPPELFSEFEASDSKGKFYNAKIKGHFKDVLKVGRVTPEEVAEEAAKTEAAEAIVDAQPAREEIDLGITDEDIRRVDPNWKPLTGDPSVALAEPEILTPDQAVAVIAPKSAATDALVSRLHRLAAVQLTVTDKASQTAMETHLVNLTTARKAVFDLIDPYRAIAYAAYDAIQSLNKSRLSPADEALVAGKRLLNAYIQAEQEKARAEQRRLQAEADAQAERDRQKRTEELRLQMAQEAQERGDTAAAEATLFDTTIEAPPVYTPAVQVEAPTSTLGGRENWKAKCVDFEEAILDCAKGIEASRKSGGLQGHIPTTVFKINDAGLTALAKANKKMFRFPGLEAWDDRVIVTTKQKG
jgi:hypothetical protein